MALICKLAQGTQALQLVDHKLRLGKEATVSVGFRRAVVLL